MVYDGYLVVPDSGSTPKAAMAWTAKEQSKELQDTVQRRAVSSGDFTDMDFKAGPLGFKAGPPKNIRFLPRVGSC